MAEAFDTLNASNASEEQSKGIARVIGAAVTGHVATKDDLEKLWLKARIHMYLTQGASFLALIAVLKDWSEVFG
ncbi:MAG: hypothetical protein F4W90_05725 [Gammaproteobacteria bacterium]|nr:hypothetical protein [Gammaproteobacteria bacterium]